MSKSVKIEVSSEKPAFSLISAPSPDNTNQIEQQPKLSTQLYRSIDQEAGPINALPAEKTAKKEERRCNIEISVDVNKITEKTLEFRKEQCNEQIAEKSSKSLATSTAAPSLDCDRLSIPIIHLSSMGSRSSMPKSGRNLNNPEELCSSNKASAKVNTTNIEQQICEETTKKLQNADNLYSPSNDSMKKIQRDYDQVICFQARSKNKEGKPSCEPKFSKTNADQIIVNKTNPGAFKEKKSAELQIDSVKENTSLKEELFNKALSQLA
ncbi:unnamed protein product [Dracunculus medinensis]|uniref:Uncharacterized protein n=1 Tax=Dracunculus medinensis TaxID=318479 RepID=A0A0N4UNC3_DRAME|nr:unnamed protein product [Dracunculus medinensis]